MSKVLIKMSNNKEIIKNSILFPIRNYKQFIIITALFLLSEIIQEHFLHQTYNDATIIPLSFILIILPLLVLGINLQIIFHIIGKNKGLPNLSFKKSLKEAMHDFILEAYYFILTVLISIVLAIPAGVFNNIPGISTQLYNLMMEIEEMNVVEVIGALPNLMILEYSHTILIFLLIFIITLTVMFSMCTLGKIDMEVNHKFSQAFNIKYILGLIKKIGVLKYLGFLALVSIMCTIVANIVFILNVSPMFGSLFSAFLEAFSLTFFLSSFAQLYPE